MRRRRLIGLKQSFIGQSRGRIEWELDSPSKAVDFADSLRRPGRGDFQMAYSDFFEISDAVASIIFCLIHGFVGKRNRLSDVFSVADF